MQLILPDDAIQIDNNSWQIACPLCESNCTIRDELGEWTAECEWGCDSQQIIEGLTHDSNDGLQSEDEPVEVPALPREKADRGGEGPVLLHKMSEDDETQEALGGGNDGEGRLQAESTVFDEGVATNTDAPANSEASVASDDSVESVAEDDEIKIADEPRESQGQRTAKIRSPTIQTNDAGRRVAHPEPAIPLGITHQEAGMLALPPQDIFAEQSLLGSVLLNAQVSTQIQEMGFKPEYFYRPSHAEIWRAMLMITQGQGSWKHEPGDEVDPQSIDAVTLSHELKTRGSLEQVGGVGYIAELAVIVPTAANAARYADIVMKMWGRRRFIEETRAVTTAAYNGVSDADIAARWRAVYLPVEVTYQREIILEGKDMSEELNKEYLNRAEIIEGLGYSQSIMLVIGGKHSGKTTNLRTLALSVARGLPIWNRATTAGPVLYCASDDEVVSTRNELLQMGWSMDDPLGLVRMRAEADGTKVLAAIADEAIKTKAVLIIVDMLFDWVGIKDEMSYAGTREAINQLQHLADRTGCLVVASHHTPKYLNEGHNAGNAALGSQGISARFSPIVLVRKWADKLYVVDSTPTRDPRGKEIKPLKIVRNEQGWIETAGEFKEWMKWEIYAQRILDVFENDKQGLSVYSIAEKVGIDRTRVQHSIKEMVDKGMLKREKQGRQYRYYLGSSNMFEREGGNWN